MLHEEASTNFQEAAKLTSSAEARNTLEVLSRQHLARSKFLSEQRHIPRTQGVAIENGSSDDKNRSSQQPVYSEELTASLATARGIQAHVRPKSPVHANKKPGGDDDPFYKFYSTVTSTFSKTLQSTIAKEEAQMKDKNLSRTINTNESFYVVPNTTSLSTEELITENASLRQAINRSSIQLQAHETAYKKQKDTLKNSLIQLKNEINQRQGSKMKDYEFEIERLKSENDKLKIQIGRLKSRWDELKESARKRRTEDDKEEKDP